MNDFLEGSSDVDTGSDAGAYEGASDDFFGDLGDAFMDQVDSVDLGEDGSIEMKVRQPEPETAAPSSADSESSAGSSGESESGQPSRDAEFLEGQYKEVQGWATRVSQENATLKAEIADIKARMDQPSTPAQGDEAESDVDPDTQAQLDSYMEKNLGTVLSKQLGIPVEEVGTLLQEAQINRELRAAYAKYDDFDAYMPVMQEISQKYPKLSFDQLYGLATTFYKADPATGEVAEAGSVDAPGTPLPQGTPQSPAPQPQQPQPSQADLQAKAKQVATLQSNSNDEGFAPERTIKTPRDAAMQALEDMGG